MPDNQELLIAAIDQLDKTNSDLFTTDGSPRTDALEEITGADVSADERDAAWKVYQTASEKQEEQEVKKLDLTGAASVVTMEGGKAVTKWYRNGKLIHVAG